MAPMLDDFVLTISDTEDIPDAEEDQQEVKAKNTKRKRNEPDHSKVKKQKSSREEQEWENEGEDDGAMDPDFEFQLDAGDTGTFEDFDGWAMGQSSRKADVNGDKKGVNIDDLIARRQKT